ncbi:MAG: cobalamin biosynthesis protein CobQ [Paracoccaceae bacterium]
MNTPAHLLLGAAIFARPLKTSIILGALVGAFIPDLSLYLMAGVALFVMNISPYRVFNELYFSDPWQTVFAIDNSIVVWSVLLAIAIWTKRSWAVALCGSALLHLFLDFPLHHDDGRPHFWPLTGWVFESPFSYWDVRHGAQWIAPIEASLATLACITLWVRRSPIWLGCVCLLLLGMEFWVVRQWLFFFVDSA